MNCYSPNFKGFILMKNSLNNQVGILGDMFLWLVANLKQGVIYFIKQALPPNISAGSVWGILLFLEEFEDIKISFWNQLTVWFWIKSWFVWPFSTFSRPVHTLARKSETKKQSKKSQSPSNLVVYCQHCFSWATDADHQEKFKVVHASQFST